MKWLGLDIGGANLKAADGRGWAQPVPFALWRQPEGLASALADLVERSPAADSLAVTMTGELCDCFESKAAGVRHILTAVGQVAKGRDVRIYLVDGRFVSMPEAMELPQLAAASNWHALARFACRFVTGRTGLLIDIGSTTTDIIPLVNGQIAAHGRNDMERLRSGELLYRGIGRTPICAILNTLRWRGERCPIAAEFFATTGDAYVLTGDVNEDPDADWPADGRPLTKAHAQQRLARLVCADATDFTAHDFALIAKEVRDTQIGELGTSIQAIIARMPERPSTYILSGSGEFIGRPALEGLSQGDRAFSLAREIGPQPSGCAPAHALAVLSAEIDSH